MIYIPNNATSHNGNIFPFFSSEMHSPWDKATQTGLSLWLLRGGKYKHQNLAPEKKNGTDFKLLGASVGNSRPSLNSRLSYFKVCYGGLLSNSKISNYNGYISSKNNMKGKQYFSAFTYTITCTFLVLLPVLLYILPVQFPVPLCILLPAVLPVPLPVQLPVHYLLPVLLYTLPVHFPLPLCILLPALLPVPLPILLPVQLPEPYNQISPQNPHTYIQPFTTIIFSHFPNSMLFYCIYACKGIKNTPQHKNFNTIVHTCQNSIVNSYQILCRILQIYLFIRNHKNIQALLWLFNRIPFFFTQIWR